MKHFKSILLILGAIVVIIIAFLTPIVISAIQENLALSKYHADMSNLEKQVYDDQSAINKKLRKSTPIDDNDRIFVTDKYKHTLKLYDDMKVINPPLQVVKIHNKSLDGAKDLKIASKKYIELLNSKRNIQEDELNPVIYQIADALDKIYEAADERYKQF